MKKYTITLMGCDDATSFKMELTEEKYEFLQSVSRLTKKASSYGCMPTMVIEESQGRDDDENTDLEHFDF